VALVGVVVAGGTLTRPSGPACNGGGLLGVFTASSLTVCPADSGNAGSALAITCSVATNLASDSTNDANA